MSDDDILSSAEYEEISAASLLEPEAKSQKVLIVDDDCTQLVMLSGVLQTQGIQSLTAENAAEAMDLLVADNLIGLVITDLRMMPVDGLEFIRSIRKSVWADVPIVVISGDAGIRDAIDAMHLGIVDFLLKPIEPAQLIPLVFRELGIKT